MGQSITKPSYRRFNQWVCLSTLLGLLGVGGLNVAVDPYGVLGSPTLSPFNRLKPNQIRNVRMFKAAEITRLQPTAVLMGSSRVDIGLDPAHPQLAPYGSAYNLGLSGANMHEVRQYFEHAIANQPDLKLAVMGLDFFMFNVHKTDEVDFNLNRLQRQGVTPTDWANVTLSVDALEASLATIAFNLSPSPLSLYHTSGQRYDFDAPPLKPKQEFTAMTAQLLETRGYYRDHELSDEFLAELHTVVELAQTHGIELKLFISPTHATLVESLKRQGLWSQYEEWIRSVVAIAPVWDFSGYNSITTEPLSETMSHYVDTSHYSSAVGDLILSRLLSEHSPTLPASDLPADFGAWVTPETLDSHFDQVASNRAKWLQTSAQELQFVYQSPSP